MLPFPALHGMIYQVVMEKKKKNQVKTSKERNNWIEVVQPGLLCLPACPDKCRPGKGWRSDTALKFRSSNRE